MRRSAAQNTAHVVVDFDQWASAAPYRLEKLAELGLAEVDNGLGRVQAYGGGSSFTGFKGAVEASALATRWETMKDGPFALGFLRIALADEAFMAALGQSYPEDSGIITQLIA